MFVKIYFMFVSEIFHKCNTKEELCAFMSENKLQLQRLIVFFYIG